MGKLGNLAEQFRVGWAGWCLIGVAVGLGGCGGAGANGGSGGGGTPTVATPVFSVAGGTYTAAQSVTITSATPGATIYYTTNGTTPTTASSVYSAPVSVTASETLEAIAVESGYNSSAVASVAYVINLPPVANVGGPYSLVPGASITFNGSGSSSPQGKTLTYAWNFGDGNTATGVSPTHIFATAGTYTVQLTVTDSSNVSSTASVQLIAPNGRAYASQKALSGAHVYVLAANTTGYGGAKLAAASSNASISLLSAASTGQSDSVGAYVTTGSDGSFLISGDYTCTAGSQVYLYALGGSNGSGTNTAIGLLAALGTCPSGGTFAATPYVVMNEVSTIATAYAIAGFATDATHVSSSGTALAKVGIANAFAATANLETLGTGVALATTPAGNGNVPQAEINTLANVLADCTGSGAASSNACSLLMLMDVTGYGATGATPTDTATAAIAIAHNPAVNVSSVYFLATQSAIFAPYLTAQPNDFTLPVLFSAGTLYNILGLAVDGSGNVWVANNQSVTKLSSTGVVLSGSNGYVSSGSLYQPYVVIGIDQSGNAWVGGFGSNGVGEIASTGAILSGSSGYVIPTTTSLVAVAIDSTGNAWVGTIGNGSRIFEISSSGTLLNSGYGGTGVYEGNCIAFDTSGDLWVPGKVTSNVVKLSSTGAVLSGSSGYTGGGISEPGCIAIDHNGNAWVANLTSNTVTELSSSGAILSGTNGFGGGGLNYPEGIAIDGAGNVWVTNNPLNNYVGVATIVEISNSLTIANPWISGSNGFLPGSSSLSFAGSLAIDGAGNVWVPDSTAVVELIGAAAPVVTPISVGVQTNMLGTRP